MVSRRPLAIALAAAVALAAAAPGSAPLAVAGLVPPCRYADVLTRYRAPTDWDRTLLDTELRLPLAYAPSDLVPVARAGVAGGGLVRRIVIDDLAAMARAARAAGAPFAVQSAYRSYRGQVSTFGYWVSVAGRASALLGSARPGHSEHQLGTTLDFRTPGGAAPWRHPGWGTTRAGAWLARHAWRFGFVMSYPRTRSPSRSCYRHEPWHYRYLGRQIARAIHESGLSTREWLYGEGAAGTWRWAVPSPAPAPTLGAEPTEPAPMPGPDGSPVPEPTPAGASQAPEPTPAPSTTQAPEPTPNP